MSGVLALFFARGQFTAVKTFCVVFGSVYALLGIIGFAVGGPGGMWTVVPDRLSPERWTMWFTWSWAACSCSGVCSLKSVSRQIPLAH